MADTVYVDGATLLTADTMNDLNRLHYTILGDPANAAEARSSLGAIGSADAVSFSNTVALSGDISPSQITANQNDYNPTGLSTASVLRLDTDASRDITGLQGGADGRLIVITNVGSFAMVLKDESASSTAANRFALAADITLAADQSVVLQYDSTSSRWRAVALPAGAAGAAGDVQTFDAGGTWTKPASGTMALIEVWGAGGGGARQAAGNSAGGGGGGYSFLWKKLSDLGATETVTIGGGGAVQNTDATGGNNGGTTSFGAHITHVGGSGGNRSAAGASASSPMCGGVGAVQGHSGTTTARSGANSQCAGSQATCVPLGSAGINSTSVSATDAAVSTCVPCMMGGGNGGGVSTVLNAQGTGGTSAFGGAGGNGNKAGAGATGAQPGGGGGAGTTGGGAGGDGRVKVSVF